MLQPFNSDSNSSVLLSEATQFHLSISLEWLTGCQFSCKGCHVDKTAGSPYTKEALGNLTKWLVSMVEYGTHLPTIAFIGPTDFLTANNTIDVLTNDTTKSILRLFKRISLQTTFLNTDGQDAIIEVLQDHYPDKELEINFVIEPEKINNEKYMKTIKEARSSFMQKLNWQKYVASFCILNVYEYDQVKKGDARRLLADYKQLNDRIRDEFGTTIDFNFSMLRTAWWSNEDIRGAVLSISRIFDEGVTHEFSQSVRFSFGKLNDSKIEKHYNWGNGKFYVSPMLYERIVSFHPTLFIPMTEYSAKETEHFEHNLLVKQYDWAKDKDDCKTCIYKASCIDRNILTFMSMHDINSCIIARKALDVINVI